MQLYLIFIPALFGIGFATQALFPESESQLPPIQISNEQLNFGNVWEGADASRDITVDNQSDHSLVVRVTPTCGCARIFPNRFSLSPRGHSAFHLDLKVPEIHASSVDEETSFRTDLLFSVGGSDSPAKYSVTARVRSPIMIKSKYLHFGDAIVGMPVTQKNIAVKFTSGEFTLLSIQLLDQNAADVAIVDKSGVLSVLPRLANSPGSFSIPLSLSISNSSTGEIIKTTCYVQGRWVTDLVISPESLTFGVGSVGTTSHQIIQFTSRSGKDLSQFTVISPFECETTVTELPESTTVCRRFKISQSINREGPSQFLLRITDMTDIMRHDDCLVPVWFCGRK